MKMVTIRRCPAELRRLLQTADAEEEEEYVVVRVVNGGEVLLSLIDDFDYELAAQRRSPKLMAFLDERRRQAGMEKGIPLEEAWRHLGLPKRSSRVTAPVKLARGPKTIDVSPRSRALLDLLEQVRSEDVIFHTSSGSAAFLTAIQDGDREVAHQRRSETVMRYCDELGEQGKLPPLEVVFVDKLPNSASTGKKPARRKAQASRTTNKKVKAS